ncbi:HNH endonuclease [Salinibacillus kushneri]|uniref:Putative HNH nuclease YajD n=1 Tax=Salinibacillus kushneri TaxID=237682 RepID=A0A1I0B4Y7_9BACI|nr:HNH endonuclease [Salinibacillus kushneri]SET01793.1 HNH endonuclease [Salinibacillus kushneri]
MKQVNPFYKSKRWKRKREVILRRDEYQCRHCRRYGKVTPAATVHHIYPLEDYPEYKLTNINLLSLCNTCHEQMHDRYTNELTDIGLKWVERIKDKVPHLLHF